MVLRLGVVIPMALLAVSSVAAVPTVRVTDLKCEHLRNPLGVESTAPRLRWVLQTSERGQRQSAYQVLVASSEELLSKGKGDLWDSGKVKSDQSVLVPYSGKPLTSGTQCWWKVRAWDKAAKPTTWSESAHWSVGILKPEDWKAKWIAMPEQPTKGPMPLFRKSVNLSKSVKHAEVNVCGLGQFEMRVNGQNATDAVLEPGWTNYRKNCPYVTYDVTRLLQKGENVLGIMLGNGMYNVPGGRYIKFGGSFGLPKMILQLKVDYADGTSDTIISDSNWKTSPGPIVFSCTYGGEDYDARSEQPGWDKPDFDDSSWVKASEVDGPGGVLAARPSPPIKIDRDYPPVKTLDFGPTKRVYDLGQNLSGWPLLKVKGPAGSAVKITMNEGWDGKSELRGWLDVQFNYTLKGQGEETWHPRFTYYGYRYAQVELIPDQSGTLPQVLDIRSQFVHTASESAGEFQCSNDTVNRIHRLINMAILSNYQSVLTDCPHREKLGWLEQAHLVAGGVMSNYDSAAFYGKIMRDMSEAQLPDGLVPDIAPEYTVFGGGFRDSPEWGSAYVICPWQVYQEYGDRSLLEKHYDGMKNYVLYLKSKAQDNIVAYGLGDWYDIGPGGPGESKLTSRGLTSTAIFYNDIMVMKSAAGLLGKQDDVKLWTDLGQQVKDSFNKRFYHADTGSFDSGSQTANAMPLVTGLAEESTRQKALDALVKDVRSRDNRVTAGDVGFKFLVRALAGAGRDDVVWDMVTQDKGPGYVWQLNSGATTLTEAWDGGGGSSRNHLMLGHAEEWFYRGLAGITETSPGYRTFSVRPAIVGDLTWVKAHRNTPYGRIESSWKLDGGKLLVNVAVPAGTMATVSIPAQGAASVTEGGKPAAKAQGVKFLKMDAGRAVFAVQSGGYSFAVPYAPVN